MPTFATADFDRSGFHLTVYVAGELDQESAPSLTAEVLRHVQPADKVVWLDLSAVTFCGSAGVSMFVALHRRCEEQGARLTLYRPTPATRRVLDMLGLAQLRVWTDARSSGSESMQD